MKPQKLTIILTVLIATLLIAGGAGYYFAIKHLSTGTTELQAQLTKQAQAEADLMALAKAKRQYDTEITPLLPLVDSALPRAKQQTEILAQLQRLAKDSGLSLSGVTMPSPTGLPSPTSQTVASGTALALPISFQLSGSYQQLQTFLAKVETLSRFTNVTNLIVSRPDKSKPITYSISLNAYVKP